MSDMFTKKINDLRVAELKVELEKRGLDKSGLKPALVKRLITALGSEELQPDAFGDGLGQTPTKPDPDCLPIEACDSSSLNNSAEDIKPETSIISINQSIFESDTENTTSVKQEDDSEKLTASGSTSPKVLDITMPRQYYDREEPEEDHDALNLTIGDEDRQFGMEDEEESNMESEDIPAGDEENEENLVPDDSMETDDGVTDGEKSLDTSEIGAEEEMIQDNSKESGSGTGDTVEGQKSAMSESTQLSSTMSSTPNDSKNSEEAKAPAVETVNRKDPKSEGRVVIVTGFSSETRAMEIKKLFQPVGKISGVKIISLTNKHSGASRFAQVTMFSSEDATNCLKLDKYKLYGRILRVEKEKAKIAKVVSKKPVVPPSKDFNEDKTIPEKKPDIPRTSPSSQKNGRKSDERSKESATNDKDSSVKAAEVSPIKDVGATEKTKQKTSTSSSKPKEANKKEVKPKEDKPKEDKPRDDKQKSTTSKSKGLAKAAPASTSAIEGLEDVSNHEADGKAKSNAKKSGLEKRKFVKKADHVDKPRAQQRGTMYLRKEYSPKRRSRSKSPRHRRGQHSLLVTSPSPPRGAPYGRPYTHAPYARYIQQPAPRYLPGSSSFVYRDTRDRDEEQRRQMREAERERERMEQLREKRDLDRQKRDREVERRRLADQEQRNKLAFMEIQKEKQRVQKEKEQLALLQEQILQAELKRQKDERERVVREHEEALRKKSELDRLAAQAQKRAYTDDFNREFARKKPHVEAPRYYDPYGYDGKPEKSASRPSGSGDRYNSSGGRDEYSRREPEREWTGGDGRRESDRDLGRPSGDGRRDLTERDSGRTNGDGRREPARELVRPSSDSRRDRHKGQEALEMDKSSRRKYTPVRDVPAPARGKATHSSSDWDDQKRRTEPARHGRVVPKSPPHASGSDGRQATSSSGGTSALKPPALRDSRSVRVYGSGNDGSIPLGSQIMHEGSYGDTSDAWMRRTASYVTSNIPTLASAAAQVTSGKETWSSSRKPSDVWMNDGSRGMRQTNEVPERWVSGSGSTLPSNSTIRSIGVVTLPAMVPPPPPLYLHSNGIVSGSSSQYPSDRFDTYKQQSLHTRRY